jgi:ATP-dependent helicase/nuclease subunit A
MTTLPDKHARQAALDPYESFIVQAPAGSGKTELLIQRFLVLLAHAEKSPEEIIAITFTRKAASEMRQRVLDALEAAQLPPPTEDHAKLTWDLACQALSRDKEKHWRILENPHRLQIQTIDSLCANLMRRMPLSAGFGSAPNTLDDPRECYLEAARRLIAALEKEEYYSQSIAYLLEHLGNHVTVLERLLVEMLGKRDQWLPYIISRHQHPDPASFREMLENSLKHIVLESIEKCYVAFPASLQQELLALLQFSAHQLSLVDPDNPIATYKDIDYFPRVDIADYDFWSTIADFLLTEKGTWRKSITKNHGFPADEKPTKARMVDLLNALQGQDFLRSALAAIKNCPPYKYTEQQWKVSEALLDVLPILVAELNVVFGERNVSDFTEITLAAIRALGELDEPSELALILDYQIRHFLIDEFQDTSTTQSRLLTHLTNGWENDDGRTLFVVGDPMQSIYRFREAEVGLFLKAQQEGIGNVTLKSLFLAANFRSTPNIIDWVNDNFTHIFPATSDISSGAVCYNASTTIKEYSDNSNVHIYPCINKQSQHVIKIIQEERKQNPHNSIAILVKSRNHLFEIIPALKAANLAFSAVEIEALNHQSITQDLFALTSALIHLSDRASWLAILRAPWCGLTLKDLYAIAAKNHHIPLWETLKNFSDIPNLSDDGKARLQHIVPVLAHSIKQRQRLPLKTWIKQTWAAISGPSCLCDDHEYAIAETFFSLLESIEAAGDIADLSQLSQKINEKFATPKDNSEHALNIMTIHKSKGLEFDTVIIPHLESKSRNESERLLRWLERPRSHGTTDLLLAPIKSKDDKEDAIYKYLHLAETQKKQYEMARLLYVATTRAKKNLHLLASVDEEKTKKPAKNSFLHFLKNVFENHSPTSYQSDTGDLEKISEELLLHRLPVKNLTNDFSKLNQQSTAAIQPKQTDNTIELQRIIGIITHRILQKANLSKNDGWKNQLLCKRWLLESGVEVQHIESSLEKISHMVNSTLHDSRGKWILAQRADTANELPISTVINGKITHFIIDRTFVDEHGIRWIIDYKTGAPKEGESVDDFLNTAKNMHCEQLHAYAAAFSKMDTRQIKLGLYFPAFAGWVEWANAEASRAAHEPPLQKSHKTV